MVAQWGVNADDGASVHTARGTLAARKLRLNRFIKERKVTVTAEGSNRMAIIFFRNLICLRNVKFFKKVESYTNNMKTSIKGTNKIEKQHFFLGDRRTH